MISWNTIGDGFNDVFEVQRHANSGTYYFKPKDHVMIRGLLVNNVMHVKCDAPELKIRMYNGDIILYPYDPNLVLGCEIECHFDNDMKFEIKVEFIGYSEISGDKIYKLYLNISKI